MSKPGLGDRFSLEAAVAGACMRGSPTRAGFSKAAFACCMTACAQACLTPIFIFKFSMGLSQNVSGAAFAYPKTTCTQAASTPNRLGAFSKCPAGHTQAHMHRTQTGWSWSQDLEVWDSRFRVEQRQLQLRDP